MKTQSSEITSIGSHIFDLELIRKKEMIDSFVYNCSHGIRSPIKTMEGLVRLMNAYPTAPEERKNYLTLLQLSAVRIQSIFNQFQELKLNSENDLSIQRINFSDLLDEVLDTFKPGLIQSTILPTIRINQKGKFYSDKTRLSIILKKLVSNSLNYHDPAKDKKKISIFVTSSPASCSLQVHDNGIGIQKSEQNKIFDLFFRATIRSTGTGLGLYIAKQITKKIEGELTFQSNENFGSVFSLWTPNQLKS
jgi:signal transduction histidine kinase